MDPMRNTEHDGPAGHFVILSFQVFFFQLFTSKKKGQKLLEILNLRFLGGRPLPILKKVGL